MKPRIARSSAPNVGIRNQFAKKVKKLLADFRAQVFKDLIDHFFETGKMAEDASLSRPRDKIQARNTMRLKHRIIYSMRQNPEAVRADIDKFINDNLLRWMNGLNIESEKVAEWYVKNMAVNTTMTQKRAFEAAGMKASFFKRWKVPTVKGQYLSPKSPYQLADIVQETTSLITNIGSADLLTLQQVTTEALSSGATIGTLRKQLRKTEGFTAKRADRVALDQGLKINGKVQNENAKALGLTKARWVHVPGQFSSRETHVKMNGKEFDIREGLFDKDVGRKVLPKELYYCRCEYMFSIPEQYLKE